MSTTLADPVRMMQMGAPHLIGSDEELELYTKALFELTAKENPTGDEMDAINLLSMLVECYNAEHYPIRKISGVEMLRYLVEVKGVTQQELAGVLGSQPLVSLILSGDRNLTVPHIMALSDFFQVAPEAFLPGRRT